MNQDPPLGPPEPPTPERSGVGRAGRADLPPGTEFAGYRIESVLGRGGMSVVYLAEHLGLKRKVALKLLAPQLAEDPRFRERFVRESQVAASIDHPNVIPIYEAGEAEGELFIAMRYVEGTDLRALLHGQGRLEEARTVRIVRQVAGALDAAHARGLVHRDVKPGNVLIAATDESQSGEHVYLSDFGLTKRAASDSGVTGTGQFVGTLDYATPEQFEGRSLDAQTDVYSLGCLLYECLAGRPPFRRENDAAVMYAHLLEEPPPLTSTRPELPEGIDAVVARAMAKKPEERFQRAGDLAAAAAGALGFTTGDLPSSAPVRRRRRRSKRTVVIAAVAAVVAVTLVAILLPNVFGGGGGSTARTSAGMAIIDARTGEHLAFVPRSVVEEPAEAIYADGHFWVLNLSPISFVEIDPMAGKVLRQIASPFDDVGSFAIDENTLWVTQFNGSGLSKIDVALGREVDRFALSDDPQQGGTSGVVVGDGTVWVGRPGEDDGHGRIGLIFRVDPDTGRVEHRFPAMYGVYGLSFADDQVWTNANGVTRIDPATNAVAARAGISGNVNYVAAGGGFGWLAMPFFCPVPTDTPIVGGGAVRGAVSGVGGGQTVPSAGPYYIADHFNGEYHILKRNPNYTGPRPHAFDAIALREGIDPGQAVGRVNAGTWGGVTNLYDPLFDLGGALSEQWGPASQAAADGDQRYFATPWPHTGFIALNASRPLFADADVRRAAALALDRQALAAVYGQIPTAQLLPPAMPGYEDRDLEGPDIAAAKALMDGRTGTAVMAIFSDCPTCVQEAQVVQAGLARIGIDVRIEEFDNPFDAVRQPGAKIDLLDDGTSVWLADPAAFLSQMLLEDMPTSWLPPGVEARVRDVLALEGPERVAAAASLADELATKDVPVVADGISVIGEFLSPRLGCLVFPPFGYGVDLAALCPNGGG